MATEPADRYASAGRWPRTSSAGWPTSRSPPTASPRPPGWCAGAGGIARWSPASPRRCSPRSSPWPSGRSSSAGNGPRPCASATAPRTISPWPGRSSTRCTPGPRVRLTDRKGMDADQRDLLVKAARFYERFALPQSADPAVRLEAGRAGLRAGEILARLGTDRPGGGGLRQGAAAAGAPWRRPTRPMPGPGGPWPMGTITWPTSTGVSARRPRPRPPCGGPRRFTDAWPPSIRRPPRPEGPRGGPHRAGEHRERPGPARRRRGLLPRRPSRCSRTSRATTRGSPSTGATRRRPGIASPTSSGASADRPRRWPPGSGPSPRTEVLARDHPDVARYRAALARVAHNLGTVQSEVGRPAEAMASYRRAAELREALVRDHPDVPLYRDELAGTYNNLGNLLRDAGKPSEARHAFEQAVAIKERLARDHPDVAEYRSSLAISLANLGFLLDQIGCPAEALPPIRRAATLQERLVRDHPDVVGYRGELASSLAGLGSLQRQAGKRGRGAAIAAAGPGVVGDAAAGPAHRPLQPRLRPRPMQRPDRRGTRVALAGGAGGARVAWRAGGGRPAAGPRRRLRRPGVAPAGSRPRPAAVPRGLPGVDDGPGLPGRPVRCGPLSARATPDRDRDPHTTALAGLAVLTSPHQGRVIAVVRPFTTAGIRCHASGDKVSGTGNQSIGTCRALAQPQDTPITIASN